MTGLSATERANRLANESRHMEAIALLKTAGDAGDVNALMLLATWNLSGHGIPRNLLEGRALLRKAVEIGHVDAALMEIALIATGSGAPPDWQAGLALLRKAAEGDYVAAAQLQLLGTMNLDDAGYPMRPPQSIRLGSAPEVLRFPAFVTAAEAAHIAQVASDMLEPAKIVDPATGLLRPHPIRSSDAAAIGPAREDLVVGAINRRIATISKTDPFQGEPLTVLRYQPGQQYRLHHDALPPGTDNQRIRTVIIYLNQGYEGGQTVFPANGLSFTAQAGDAIMFDNCLADGTVDLLSRHAGLPVTKGAKWIATRWIRQSTYDPWAPR